MPVTVVVDGYRALPESLTAIRLVANPANGLRSRTPVRLSVCDTLLERLPQDLEDMAAALGQCIQEEHAVVGQRHLARHRHVAPADQPGIRDGVVRRATRAGRDQGRPVAREAGDAMDARRLNSPGEGHGRQEGGEPPGPPRRARPRRPQEARVRLLRVRPVTLRASCRVSQPP
jgi:hypothetical protein